jgi:manganese/zinc/iron transport system ATP- binding protein
MIWLTPQNRRADPGLSEVPLAVSGLTVGYGDRPLVADLDLHLRRGERFAVVGPNGAGKSSLLKSLLGLLPPWTGKVRFFGLDLERARARLAYVPQREEVDWEYPASARDVVEMGRYQQAGLWRRLSALDQRLVSEALERVGLSAFADAPIGRLSGGQQQRIFLARALCSGAELFLLDEPFAGIDAKSEAELHQLLAELCAEGRSALVVHHDLNTVAQRFDRALLLGSGGHQIGPVSEVLRPENLERAYGASLSRY